MFDNFNTVELWWTGAALVGLLASLFNIYISRHQLAAVARAKVMNGRRIIALTRFIRDMMRTLVQLMYLGLGLWAGTRPGEASSGAAWVLVATSMVVTLMTLVDAGEREYILRHGPNTRSS